MVPDAWKILAISRHSSKSRRPSPASSTTNRMPTTKSSPTALRIRLVHHQPEPAAVLHRAAEPVGAVVRRGRQELPDEVRSGQGLDAVESAFPAPGGRPGVVLHDPSDIVLVHLLRERPVQRLAQRGRTDRSEARPRVGLAATADMGDLAHQKGPACVDTLREPLEVLDDALVVQVDLGKVPLRIRRDVRRAAEHGERDPALRLRLVVPLVAVGGHPALGEAARVARAHDAVPEREVLQAERLKERIAGGELSKLTRSGSRERSPVRERTSSRPGVVRRIRRRARGRDRRATPASSRWSAHPEFGPLPVPSVRMETCHARKSRAAPCSDDAPCSARGPVNEVTRPRPAPSREY